LETGLHLCRIAAQSVLTAGDAGRAAIYWNLKEGPSVNVRTTETEADPHIVTLDGRDSRFRHLAAVGRQVTPGRGLLLILDRIEAAGGTLDITSAPRHGAHLRARIPLEF